MSYPLEGRHLTRVHEINISFGFFSLILEKYRKKFRLSDGRIILQMKFENNDKKSLSLLPRRVLLCNIRVAQKTVLAIV